MNNFLKKTFFAIVIISLILATGVIVRIGSFEKLEGYMYSLAVEETNIELPENATPSNVVPENATPSNAVPENATPSNAVPENATPSNAVPENATPSNAVPENATPSNAVPENATPSDINEESVEVSGEVIENEETVSFLESEKMYIIVIAASVLVVAVTGVIVIIYKLKK